MIIIKYALRGCLGFGLGGLVLILGLHIAGPRPEESQGLVGKWYGKASSARTAIKIAEFKGDGSFSFQMQNSTQVSGTYTKTDEDSVTMEGDTAYTKASVSRGTHLHLGNDEGT